MSAAWIVTDEEVNYYATLANAKKVNADYYKAMLPLLLKKVNEDYKTKFVHTDLPANVEIFLAKAVAFYSGATGLKSRKMGSVSYSYNFDELPATLTSLLEGYRKAKYHVFRRF